MSFHNLSRQNPTGFPTRLASNRCLAPHGNVHPGGAEQRTTPSYLFTFTAAPPSSAGAQVSDVRCQDQTVRASNRSMMLFLPCSPTAQACHQGKARSARKGRDRLQKMSSSWDHAVPGSSIEDSRPAGPAGLAQPGIPGWPAASRAPTTLYPQEIGRASCRERVSSPV